MGSLILSKDGTPVDMAYQELSDDHQRIQLKTGVAPLALRHSA